MELISGSGIQDFFSSLFGILALLEGIRHIIFDATDKMFENDSYLELTMFLP